VVPRLTKSRGCPQLLAVKSGARFRRIHGRDRASVHPPPRRTGACLRPPVHRLVIMYREMCCKTMYNYFSEFALFASREARSGTYFGQLTDATALPHTHRLGEPPTPNPQPPASDTAGISRSRYGIVGIPRLAASVRGTLLTLTPNPQTLTLPSLKP